MADIDVQRLGEAALGWAAATSLLGHAAARNTADYIAANKTDSSEHRLLRAMVCGEPLTEWNDALCAAVSSRG